MKRFLHYKKNPILGPSKDWADIAYSWPFGLLPFVAIAGTMFSRLIIGNTYYIFCLIISFFITCYFLLAGVIRYKNKRTRLPNSWNPYILLVGSILYFYTMSFIATAHGFTLLFEIFAHEKHQVIATFTGKSSGGRHGCPALESSELHTAFGRALCINRQTRIAAIVGDKFAVIGRKSMFGVYVDHITLLNANKRLNKDNPLNGQKLPIE